MSKRLRSLFLVTLATAVAAPVALGATAGAAAAASRSRTITVVGTGEVRGTPDVADLVLGVSGPRRLRRRGDVAHRRPRARR